MIIEIRGLHKKNDEFQVVIENQMRCAPPPEIGLSSASIHIENTKSDFRVHLNLTHKG